LSFLFTRDVKSSKLEARKPGRGLGIVTDGLGLGLGLGLVGGSGLGLV